MQECGKGSGGSLGLKSSWSTAPRDKTKNPAKKKRGTSLICFNFPLTMTQYSDRFSSRQQQIIVGVAVAVHGLHGSRHWMHLAQDQFIRSGEVQVVGDSARAQTSSSSHHSLAPLPLSERRLFIARRNTLMAPYGMRELFWAARALPPPLQI